MHCIDNSLKKVSKMSNLPPPGKISTDAHVYNHMAKYVQILAKIGEAKITLLNFWNLAMLLLARK